MPDPSFSVSPAKDHPYSQKRRANLLACILDKQPIICAKPEQSEFIGFRRGIELGASLFHIRGKPIPLVEWY
jgi:hypothetical protein